VRRRDQALRVGLATLLLGGCLGVVFPFGLGLWDPSWLRLAGDVELDPNEPSLEPGEVRHPFVVEQSDLHGRLRWRLSGAGLRGPSDAADLLKDQLVLEPRLELFSVGGKPGQEVTRISAERARVRVSEGEGGQRRVRLDLGPALRLQRGGLSLRGEELVAWFDPDRPNDLRLKTQQPLTLVVVEEGARWELEATSLHASAERSVLGGPVQVKGGPFRGGPLDGYRVEGVAQSAVLEPRGSAEGLSGPWAVELTGLQVEGTSSAGEDFELVAERAGANLKAAESAQGSESRPTPESLSFEGGVKGRFRRASPPQDLRLAGERLTLGEREGVVLAGRGAELREETSGFRARGERFELREAPGGGLSLSARDLSELEVREAAEPARPGRTPAAPALWRGRAGSLKVEVAGIAGVTSSSLAQLWSGSRPTIPGGTAEVTTSARVTSLLERVRRLEIEGGLELARSPGPDRLQLQSLSWTQAAPSPMASALRTLRVSQLDAVVSQAESTRKETPQPGVPWSLSAGSLQLTTRESLASLAALSSGSRASTPEGELPWSRPLEAVETFEARGGVRVERRGRESDLRRRLRKGRGLQAQELSYTRASNELVTRGRKVELAKVTLGALTIAAPELSLDPRSGRVSAHDVTLGLVRLRKVEVEGRETWVREDYQARAAKGLATLSLDPADWSQERERRRGRRRSGAALTVPEPLQSLDLQGGVVASGPRSLRARANRVRLEGRRLRLDGSPAELSEERGQIAARLLRVSWEEADLAPLSSGAEAARDATRALVDAEGEVSARGSLGARSFTLKAERVRGEVYEVVGLPAKDPRAPFPLGAFSASSKEGVTLTWVAGQREGGARDLKLRSARLRGDGRALTPEGAQALRLELQGRWATTLQLPKRGISQVSGGRATALLDPSALREGARADEKEEAYLRRVLRGLSVTEGLRLSASGFEARAKEAHLDAERSAYVLSGDPVVLRRGGLRQTMRRATIRLSEE
jgi:hypothetical protein